MEFADLPDKGHVPIVRNSRSAGKPLVHIGVRHLHQQFKLLQIIVAHAFERFIGKRAQNVIHLAHTTVPCPEKQALALVVQPRAAAHCFAHLGNPVFVICKGYVYTQPRGICQPHDCVIEHVAGGSMVAPPRGFIALWRKAGNGLSPSWTMGKVE